MTLFENAVLDCIVDNLLFECNYKLSALQHVPEETEEFRKAALRLMRALPLIHEVA